MKKVIPSRWRALASRIFIILGRWKTFDSVEHNTSTSNSICRRQKENTQPHQVVIQLIWYLPTYRWCPYSYECASCRRDYAHPCKTTVLDPVYLTTELRRMAKIMSHLPANLMTVINISVKVAQKLMANPHDNNFLTNWNELSEVYSHEAKVPTYDVMVPQHHNSHQY